MRYPGLHLHSKSAFESHSFIFHSAFGTVSFFGSFVLIVCFGWRLAFDVWSPDLFTIQREWIFQLN